MKSAALFYCLALLFAMTPWAAAETRRYTLPDELSDFRPGPGAEVARDNCLSCHSADYVETQPPELGATFWEAEVSKMIKAYHAPITTEDAKTIVEYLARVY